MDCGGTETLQLHALNHSAEVVAVVVDVEAEVEGISSGANLTHGHQQPTDRHVSPDIDIE